MLKKFAIAINCIDGRVQVPVAEYIKKTFKVDYVDMFTEPGPTKLLVENKNKSVVDFLKEKARISIENHHSEIIAIAAHFDCAGNPVNEEVQKEQLRKAVDIINSWHLPVKKIIALWVNENFEPSEIELNKNYQEKI